MNKLQCVDSFRKLDVLGWKLGLNIVEDGLVAKFNEYRRQWL